MYHQKPSRIEDVGGEWKKKSHILFLERLLCKQRCLSGKNVPK